MRTSTPGNNSWERPLSDSGCNHDSALRLQVLPHDEPKPRSSAIITQKGEDICFVQGGGHRGGCRIGPLHRCWPSYSSQSPVCHQDENKRSRLARGRNVRDRQGRDVGIEGSLEVITEAEIQGQHSRSNRGSSLGLAVGSQGWIQRGGICSIRLQEPCRLCQPAQLR